MLLLVVAEVSTETSAARASSSTRILIVIILGAITPRVTPPSGPAAPGGARRRGVGQCRRRVHALVLPAGAVEEVGAGGPANEPVVAGATKRARIVAEAPVQVVVSEASP